MRKSDELSDPKSCLNRARESEWVFTLLERDIAAPGTVLDWIERRIRYGKNKADDPQMAEARQWVMAVLNELNTRRIEMCKRKSRGEMSESELTEFRMFQEAFFEAHYRVYPGPKDISAQLDAIEARLEDK